MPEKATVEAVKKALDASKKLERKFNETVDVVINLKDVEISDMDGDGIGDSPYIINSHNKDNYPLVEPWDRYVICLLYTSPSPRD